MSNGCYLAKIFYEKLQQGCWLSLLDENFEEVGGRLLFDGWCISDNSVFNDAEIQFRTPKVNPKAVAVGFYSNELDLERYFTALLDYPVELVCDSTAARFVSESLKVSFY